MTRWLKPVAAAASGLLGLGLPVPVPPARPVALATVAGTSARDRARPWPKVVAAAIAYAERRTSVPLEAPEVLPPAGLAPNSAQVRASLGEYSVALYHCPSTLAVNRPGIGEGLCGAMADYYGYFAGNAYPSIAAALGALRLAAPACAHKSRVPLAAGVIATLYSAPLAGGNCEAAWQAAHWSFVLVGDLNGGTHGDETVPWRQVADDVVSYLRGRRLPSAHGYVEVDIAGDGLHTDVSWQQGRYVYAAGTYHGVLPALALAMAMGPYPGP